MRGAATRRLLVVAGGAGGAAVRIAIDDGFDAGPAEWPWVTFLVNIAGALLLGYLVARVLQSVGPESLALPLLGTGFLGAMTTFSTFSLEVYLLGDGGRPGIAVVYATVTLVGGLAAALSGLSLAREPE